MAMGFGVDVVVGETARRFKKLGAEVLIGVIDQEPDVYADLNIRKLDAFNPVSKTFLISADPDIIILHTFPFFEQVKYLKEFAPVIFWEHGDPSPELQNEPARSFLINEKRHKQEFGYKEANGIIAISEFISSEIGDFPNEIILNGSDHVEDELVDGKSFSCEDGLKVGVLNRVGPGENRYKGVEYFHDLVTEIGNDRKIQFFFSGRGKEVDALPLRNSGIEVKLNLTEKEKIEYLRNLDVFVSFSLWEGFNLPLVEASRLGTLSLALDTGAHPEVTPFVFRNVYEMARFLKCLATNKKLLASYSKLSRQFVLKKFDWNKSSEAAYQYIRKIYIRDTVKSKLSLNKRMIIYFHVTLYVMFRVKMAIVGSFLFMRSHGFVHFLKLVKRKIFWLLRGR